MDAKTVAYSDLGNEYRQVTQTPNNEKVQPIDGYACVLIFAVLSLFHRS